MAKLILLLGDQLSSTISSLEGCDKTKDIILMCEVLEETTYVKHHKKKIAFILSAMRHYADELTVQGYNLRYIRLDDARNTGSFSGEVGRLLTENSGIEQIVVTYPGEYRVLEEIKSWPLKYNVDSSVRNDTRFLCELEEFEEWARNRKQLRMEYFYRLMRQKHDILMDNDQPVGGKWNFDSENRKTPNKDLVVPSTFQNTPDKITSDVLALVSERFAKHFGFLEPFNFAVTREQALMALNQFISQRLSKFGDFQDAMIEGEPWMYHSHLGFYLNCGLLLPLECVKAAEQAFYSGSAPLNSVEGFIRQIMGWREYVRGIYWLKMPDYQNLNYFDAKNNLPSFYWTTKTKMNCLSQCLQETEQHAYAHHIQRLMILGNFALIAGIDPAQVSEWFLIVYADAYEWVELPNVIGMILYADGGDLASKPYAAGGSYINKMSNYCKNCTYKVKKKIGPDACPFNYLYWDFLQRNRDKLSNNHRVAMMYKTYDRMDEDKKDAIRIDSESFLASLE